MVRPLLSLDGRAVSAGVAVCRQLLAEADTCYPQAALFQFFRGRLLRLEVGLGADTASGDGCSG